MVEIQQQAKPPPGDTITSNGDGTIFWYGTTVLMNRVNVTTNRGEYVWAAYALVPVTDGTHPTEGIGATTETAVWIQQGTGVEEDVRALCSQLSGIKG